MNIASRFFHACSFLVFSLLLFDSGNHDANNIAARAVLHHSDSKAFCYNVHIGISFGFVVLAQ